MVPMSRTLSVLVFTAVVAPLGVVAASAAEEPAAPAVPAVPGGGGGGEVGNEVGNATLMAPDLLEPHGVRPRRPAKASESAVGSGSVPGATASIPFTFRRTAFSVRELPMHERPYAQAAPQPLVDAGVHDAAGVRMVRIGGRLYNHPVAQAQYGILLLESYRLTGDARYLTRARAQADRIIAHRARYLDAWFFRYDFPYALHSRYQRFSVPWYSGMAQGQALSLFTRLWEVTGVSSYRVAMGMAYRSFFVRPVAGKPWMTWVSGGLLWLEEYPISGTVTGDRTYNGHGFAAFGLYDYYLAIGDPDALTLLQGALTTTRDEHLRFRNRGWRSAYCLAHRQDGGYYHQTHIGQFLYMYRITEDVTFARMADLYHYDFPEPRVSSRVAFAAGRHTGYRFDANGRVTATRAVTLPRASSAPLDLRTKVLRQTGMWLHITAGTFTGYHIRESKAAYAIGEYARLRYLPGRSATVLAAPVWAVRVDSAGRVTRVRVPYQPGQRVFIDRRAVLNGYDHARLLDGPHAGWWVPTSTVRIS
jgi:hypothetical protein